MLLGAAEALQAGRDLQGRWVGSVAAAPSVADAAPGEAVAVRTARPAETVNTNEVEDPQAAARRTIGDKIDELDKVAALLMVCSPKFTAPKLR